MNALAYQLKAMTKLLSEMNADYAVIGGIAVSIYSEPRLTLDVDVNIILSTAKVGAFLEKAKRHGFSPIPRNIKRFVRRTGVIPMRFSKSGIEGKCDFIIAQNTLEELTIRRAHLKTIYLVKVRVATPEDIVIHKITSERCRDLEDVQAILIRQGKNLDTKYISFWLKTIAELNHKPRLINLFKNLFKAYT